VVAVRTGGGQALRDQAVRVHGRLGDEPDSPLTIGERYRFEAVQTAAGWRFSRVELRPVWRSR
jgi:hypothetical protein